MSSDHNNRYDVASLPPGLLLQMARTLLLLHCDAPPLCILLDSTVAVFPDRVPSALMLDLCGEMTEYTRGNGGDADCCGMADPSTARSPRDPCVHCMMTVVEFPDISPRRKELLLRPSHCPLHHSAT